MPSSGICQAKKDNNWITKGIMISCNRKQSLYMICNFTKSPKLNHTRDNTVTGKAKLIYYDNLISSSKNKTKTTWNLIRNETGKINYNKTIPSILNLIIKLYFPTKLWMHLMIISYK
jgi:hypothetical protein